MRFRDRTDAGEQLGRRIRELGLDRPVVFGLPRGGVAVAEPVARLLAAPLEVFVARKIGAPGNPEFAIGAVAEDGVVVFDKASVAAFGLDQERLDAMADREHAEAARRVTAYRGNRSIPPLRGRDVVVVDDGLATGLTAKAALISLREAEPGRLVFAVPVGAADSVEALEELAEVVCLEVRRSFGAVGFYYDDFDQVDDDTVTELLGGQSPD